MSNITHVEKLKEALDKKDIDIWNNWRKENPEVNPDLSGEDFTGINFSGTDFTGIDLGIPNSNQLYTNDITNSLTSNYNYGYNYSFSEIDLSNVNLSDTILTKAQISNANLTNANLTEAKLSDANLANSNLTEANLTGANLNRASLNGTNLQKAIFIKADLSEANITSANLSEADLTEANLSFSDLSFAILFDSNITKAKLQGARLTETNVMYLKYNRKDMEDCYLGIRGIDSCYGNAIFKRDAQDQDFIDAVKIRRGESWWKKLSFRLWKRIDFGRSLSRVGLFALIIVLISAIFYTFFPHMIDYGRHEQTWFTPLYFSFITFTTLGFGDVTARCIYGEMFVTAEVVLGYLTLGLLLGILANTVARRS